MELHLFCILSECIFFFYASNSYQAKLTCNENSSKQHCYENRLRHFSSQCPTIVLIACMRFVLTVLSMIKLFMTDSYVMLPLHHDKLFLKPSTTFCRSSFVPGIILKHSYSIVSCYSLFLIMVIARAVICVITIPAFY